MKNFLVKYTSLFLMGCLLLIPIRMRAKVLWMLFSLKNSLRKGR